MVQASPVADPVNGRTAARVRDAGSGERLATAMADFLLDPRDRLTEQERALMGSMLAGLVGGIAQELALRLPDSGMDEVDAEALVEQLRRGGQLRHEGLIALLLRRAGLARMRGMAAGSSPLLLELAADPTRSIAAAAMAVALARSSGRDPLGRPGLSLSDCDAETAVHLTYAVAATLPGASDEQAVAAAVDLLARHDEGERLEALEGRLIIALEQEGRLDPALLLSLAARGEAWLLTEGLARIARVPVEAAWTMLDGRSPAELGRLIRLAEQTRQTAAGLIAALAEPLGVASPGEAIDAFDAVTSVEAGQLRALLRLPASFRAARAALTDS